MCQAVNLRYYCVLKINDILAPATTGKNLEDIILSEITQSQKDKYCDSTYLRCIEEADLQRHKVDGGWGIGGWVVVVQSLSRVGLFAAPWTAGHQASLSYTISWSLIKLMSTELVMPPNHLILCCPLQFQSFQ